jgi:nuclear transcription factor Y, alpha
LVLACFFFLKFSPHTKIFVTFVCLRSVNPKQFHRILKRRDSRTKLEGIFQQRRQADNQQQEAAVRKPYLHESRHKHATKRPRGPGGRFLTKKELAAEMATSKRFLNF